MPPEALISNDYSEEEYQNAIWVKSFRWLPRADRKSSERLEEPFGCPVHRETAVLQSRTQEEASRKRTKCAIIQRTIADQPVLQRRPSTLTKIDNLFFKGRRLLNLFEGCDIVGATVTIE